LTLLRRPPTCRVIRGGPYMPVVDVA